MPDANELLNIAIKKTENLNQGEVFLVRDFSSKVMNGIAFLEVIVSYLGHCL